MLVCSLVTQTQEDIFKKYRVTKEPLTLSKEKYKETVYNEEIIQVDTVSINTQNNKGVKFLKGETTKLAYRAETTSGFLTVDPLCEEFYYEQVYSHIENILSEKTELNFRDAVLFTEYAYYDGMLDTPIIDQEYETLCRLVGGLSQFQLITYTDGDKGFITRYAAIFKVLTDTILIPVDTLLIYEHKPLTYDFEDPLGQSDWEKCLSLNY